MKPLSIVAIVLGVFLLIVAFMYFTEPAKSLPSFFPGYDATLSKTHAKHGILALVIALALFAYAWFQSGKKSTKQEDKE